LDGELGSSVMGLIQCSLHLQEFSSQTVPRSIQLLFNFVDSKAT